MRRFFRKAPPPGWEPPKPQLLIVKKPPKPDESFALFQERLRETSKAFGDLAAAHPTDSVPWTATGKTDTLPWTAAEGDR